MDALSELMRFQKAWRPYQARILAELDEHLGDRRLHVVAAPGSGKTVLGLEVVRRLNRPALILSPTLAIRDQWIQRLVELFMHLRKRPAWVSTDPRRPGLITAATYQALYMAFTRDDEADGAAARAQVIGRLKRAGVATIVIDEAHHLRTNWWKTLTGLVSGLEKVTVVALTATPPYDVSLEQWRRYRALCGPIDAEVGVPELVMRGNLCPHQDYLCLNYPSRDEMARISEFREGVGEAVEGLCRNKPFIYALQRDRRVADPARNMEEIFSDPAYFSSIAVFLNHVLGEPPEALLEVMGLAGADIPTLGLKWMERLLTGCLFRHAGEYEASRTPLDDIRRHLSRIGALERRKVLLENTGLTRKLLVSSVNKLNSICRIVHMESGVLGPDLRMVVLTDFIRKQDLPRARTDVADLTRIGVAPVFEKIRREAAGNVRLGALSGSLVIIPRAASAHFEGLAGEMGIQRPRLRPLAHDDTFVSVEVGGGQRAALVGVVTRLFTAGEITVLVGTKSLLGEGWDAPCINSLVLATFVGSYMLSNQLRGRAIRSVPGQPGKTANVWHLVCLEPGGTEGGEDYWTLERRFKAFVGVSHTEDVIENGIARLGLAGPPFSPGAAKEANRAMFEKAADRTGLINAWRRALEGGEEARMVERLEAARSRLPRKFVFANTVRALLLDGIFWGGYVTAEMLRAGGRSPGYKFLAVAFAAGGIAALPRVIKALWLAVRHGPVASSIRQIGRAVLAALCHAGLVTSDPLGMLVLAEKRRGGAVDCRIEGGTSREKALFLDALQEVLDPVENPRYLIERRGAFFGLRRRDWHAVPAVIGAKKKHAAHFLRMWKKHVGPAALVYTRNTAGRRVLTEARSRALSAAFVEPSQRLSRWE